MPAGAIVMSPVTDVTFSGDSLGRNEGHDDMFTQRAFDFLKLHYLPDAQRRAEFMASPLMADLNGLPPMYILVGSTELLLDDSVRFACKCPSATLEIWHDMPHIFPAFSFLSEAQEAVNRKVRFMDKVLEAKPQEARTRQAI
jgi:acetyl esterase/lipase